MNTLNYNNIEQHIPESWDELTRKQFKNVIRVLLVDMTKEHKKGIPTDYTKKIVLLKIILSMPWRHFTKLKKWQIAELIDLVDFLMKDITLTKQHYPKIRVGWRVFYGPAEGLVFSTFGEFAHADTQFSAHANNKSEQALHNMIATLYRPRKPFLFIRKRLANYNGDPRVPFNDATVTKRGKYIGKRMKNRHKQAVLFFFAGFRSQIVIPRAQELFKKKSSGVISARNYGWKSPLHELAGTTKFGSYKEASLYRWHEIIDALVMEIENAERKMD